MRATEFIFESYQPPELSTGDTVLMGKFKNKKTTVKDIGTDDHGMPTINGKKAATFRIPRGEEEKSNPQSVFNEVGPNDWHFKAIMKMWDTANSFTRKKIGAVVCNDPKADKNDVARTLRNYGYKEVTHVTDKLGLDEKKNLNELTQGLFAGKVKIGGQPVDLEVELLGADNKTKEFITKSNEVFGWISKNANVTKDGYVFLLSYSFLNVLEGYFDNHTEKLLKKYLNDKFPQTQIYLIM